MKDQEEIHAKCLSEDPKERIKALEQIRSNFPHLTNKKLKEKAPFSIDPMRKEIPILDRNLSEIVKEIHEIAKNACTAVQKTNTEEDIASINKFIKEIDEITKKACILFQGTNEGEIACAINRKVQKLVTSNLEEAAQNIDDIAYTLRSQVPNIPDYIHNKIDLMISENDLARKTQILSYVTSSVIGQMLKENQASININDNANNVIVNSKDSSINVNTGKETKQSGFIDSFATRAGFLGFIVLELLNIVFPLGNDNHMICISIIAIYVIFTFAKYKKQQLLNPNPKSSDD